jgi:hypothetical protein
MPAWETAALIYAIVKGIRNELPTRRKRHVNRRLSPDPLTGSNQHP